MTQPPSAAAGLALALRHAGQTLLNIAARVVEVHAKGLLHASTSRRPYDTLRMSSTQGDYLPRQACRTSSRVRRIPHNGRLCFAGCSLIHKHGELSDYPAPVKRGSANGDRGTRGTARFASAAGQRSSANRHAQPGRGNRSDRHTARAAVAGRRRHHGSAAGCRHVRRQVRSQRGRRREGRGRTGKVRAAGRRCVAAHPEPACARHGPADGLRVRRHARHLSKPRPGPVPGPRGQHHRPGRAGRDHHRGLRPGRPPRGAAQDHSHPDRAGRADTSQPRSPLPVPAG